MITILKLYYKSILRIDPNTYATAILKQYGIKCFEFISLILACALFSLIISGVFIESLEEADIRGVELFAFGLVSISVPVLSYLLLLSTTRNAVGHLRDFVKLIRLSGVKKRTRMGRYFMTFLFSYNIFFVLFQFLFIAILLQYYTMPDNVSFLHIFLTPFLSYIIAIDLLVIFSVVKNIKRLRIIFSVGLIILLLIFWTSKSLAIMTANSFIIGQVILWLFLSTLMLLVLNKKI